MAETNGKHPHKPRRLRLWDLKRLDKGAYELEVYASPDVQDKTAAEVEKDLRERANRDKNAVRGSEQ